MDDLALEEGDIPGAKLKKPAEQCTVAVLKRWLSCRGTKVTGKREDLVKRFVRVYLYSQLCFPYHILVKGIVFTIHG
jgi:hypothetical protein